MRYEKQQQKSKRLKLDKKDKSVKRKPRDKAADVIIDHKEVKKLTRVKG